jgi:hypothetical protein
MTIDYPIGCDTLAACGHCGWVGTENDLRHPEEYLNEYPSSYQGRDDDLEGGREFCPHCDESAQCWDRGSWEEWHRLGEVLETWDEFVEAMS